MKWTEDEPYWIHEAINSYGVRWRDSPNPAATFNRQDFPDALQRAEVVRAELNEAGRPHIGSPEPDPDNAPHWQ